MEYQPLPLIARPESSKPKRTAWKLGSLSVGMHFVVTDPAEYRKARAAVSAWNVKYGTAIHCTLTDRGLVVWRDGTDVSRPNKLEFLSYCLAMTLGQSFSMPSAYAARFAEFEAWLLEALETGREFDAERLADGSLRIEAK